MKKAQKLIKAQVAGLYKKLGNCVQVNIMDLGKILDAAENILVAGGAIEDAEVAMAAAIAKYRVN